MKFMHSISPADFELFQQQNMNPALSLIGTVLTKSEKRKQVAARMLGFNAFEAIPFAEDMYSYHPKKGELLVTTHPEIKKHIVLITNGSLIVLSAYGDAYFSADADENEQDLGQDNFCVNDVTEELLKKLNYKKRLFECPFEPDHIDVGFEGVKVFNIGVERMARRRLEFDIVARNGISMPLIVKASTSYTQQPTHTSVKTTESIEVDLHHALMNKSLPGVIFQCFYEVNMIVRRRTLSRDMVLWELKRMTFKEPWSRRPELIAESLDCARIAYEFLDAQSKNQNKRLETDDRISLTEMIRKWSGRYISRDDVDLAMKLHPEVQGDVDANNLSSKRVFPSYLRLKDIPDAGTHQNYSFQQRSDHELLEQFSYIESADETGFQDPEPRQKKDQASIQSMIEKQAEFFTSRASD